MQAMPLLVHMMVTEQVLQDASDPPSRSPFLDDCIPDTKVHTQALSKMAYQLREVLDDMHYMQVAIDEICCQPNYTHTSAMSTANPCNQFIKETHNTVRRVRSYLMWKPDGETADNRVIRDIEHANKMLSQWNSCVMTAARSPRSLGGGV